MLDNLSLRFKVPLRSMALILITAAAVTGALTVRAYDDLRRDVLAAAESLGQVLALGLVPELIHDDLWRAYELITAPQRAGSARPGSHPEVVVVLDTQRKVYVSTQPDLYPPQLDAQQLSKDFAALRAALDRAKPGERLVLEPVGSERFYLATPVLSDGVELGTLVLGYPRSIFLLRFTDFAARALLITLAIVAVLMPLTWIWARRMSAPLIHLADHLARVGTALPDPQDLKLRETGDEIGQVARAYRRMLGELRDKQRLEQEIVASERLAALGQMSAGIAHEINNPLGGMLNSINTLRHHGDVDAMTGRTLLLLERGLNHIRETVAALLVEARYAPHPLSRDDAEDVRVLATTEARQKGVRLSWRNELPERADVPATLMRQILLNLLLNAIQAVAQGGRVTCEIGSVAGEVLVRVTNDGRHIPEDRLRYVFEPFRSERPAGHGLGLWVTYQVVRQLDGRIEVSSVPGETVFTVTIPIASEHRAQAAA